MEIIPIKTRVLKAPKDDLLGALYSSKLKLKEGDIVAISSKVVALDEGRAILNLSIEKRELVKKHADLYLEMPRNTYRTIFTYTKGTLAGSAGIDESNSGGYFVLYPKDPFKSAKRIRKALMKHYGVKKLGILLTDSTSVPLRRGAIGIALAWDGFRPLTDYRNRKDLFGRTFKMEIANIVDGLAAGAVVAMGEGAESTPAAVIRGAPVVFGSIKTKEPTIVTPEDDIFAPLLFAKKWKKGGSM